MTVRFADAEPNGLAELVGRLIDGNLEAEPERRRLLREAVIELSASDAEIQATIRFSAEGVAVSNGSAGATASHDRRRCIRPRRAGGGALLFGFPNAFDAQGRSVLRRIATRHVRVSGMLRHPLRLSRFTRLLSVVV